MAVTSSPTKDQITNQVEQITPEGGYTANELRGLLSNIVGSLYSPFYSATSNPSTSNNQTQNYKTGSLGKNSSTGRYFVCSSATASAATWEQISVDKEFFSISASNNQTYTIPNNASTVLYSGLQGGVTVNLPTAANSYAGKKVKVFFTSPASNTGSGVTFFVPETVGPYSPNSLPANVYTSNSIIEFVFTGSGWVICQFVPTTQDIGYQVVTVTEGGTGILQSDTSIARLQRAQGGLTTYTAYTVNMPPNPYFGKVVKIMTAGVTSISNITTLTIRTSSGAAITDASGTIAQNQAIEFVFNGSVWVRVAPTTNLWMV